MADEIVSGVVNHAEGKRTFHFRKGSSDEGVVKQIFAAGEYDLMRLHRHTEILEFLQKQSARGLRPMIVDAGANIGASAVFFALTYPSALVIAIEPEEQNYALLRRNVEGLDVQCIQGALAATAGYARLADPGLGNWGFRTELTTGNGVPCITVSDLYAQRPAQTFPYIVKIDIEGGEAGLFDDAAWLAETPLVIIEPHDWLMPKAGTFRSFLRCIADQNRDFVIRGENIFSIRHEL